MKKINKILYIFIIAMIFINFISAFKFTVKAEEDYLQKMQSDASSFINSGKESATGIDANKITEEFTGIGQVLTFVGTGVLVAVTTYMGIKYLTAGPEAQAKLKQQLIGLVVAAIVIFGAYGIWKLVIDIFKQFDA